MKCFFVLKFSKFFFTKFCSTLILMVSLNINNQKYLYLIDFIKKYFISFFISRNTVSCIYILLNTFW